MSSALRVEAVRVDPQEVARRTRRFEVACREADVRLTHQRLEVFREVARTADHPDAETVFRGVRERLPTISLDTVYRTLWLLTDLGLISTLGPPRQRARFDANLERHHHFVCRRCGLTRDFYSPELDELRLPHVVRELGQVEMTQVEVRGVCRVCAVADPRKKTESREREEAEAERDE